MANLIEPLDGQTSNTLSASVLYPDVASIVQIFVQNAIKNTPKARIELQIKFAPSWRIRCWDNGSRDRSMDDERIQKLAFLGTLCTDTCGERIIRKENNLEQQKTKEYDNLICLQSFFENIPVRRTSLKNKANCLAEIRKIKDTVKALSLLCPRIHITCYVQENFADQAVMTFDYKATKHFTERFELVCGISADENKLKQIELKTNSYSIKGYVDLFDTTTLTDQIMLVNGILVRDHNRIGSGDSLIGERIHEALKFLLPDKSLRPAYVLLVSFEDTHSDAKMYENMAQTIRKSLKGTKTGIDLSAESIDGSQKPSPYILRTAMNYNYTGQIEGELDRKHLLRSVPSAKRNAIASLEARKRQVLNSETMTFDFEVVPAQSDLQVSKLKMIGQVDHKFIACMDLQTTQIILIDQHAAHERIRYEKKLDKQFTQLFKKSSDDILTIEKTIEHGTFSEVLLEDLISVKELLQLWGFCIDVADEAGSVSITSLPSMCTAEKDVELRHLFDSLANWLRLFPAQRRLDDLSVALSAQTSPSTRWMIALRHAPPVIIEKVTTWSCRGAIMFNDPLSIPQCDRLVSELGRCIFPWQCAHGRPTSLIVSQLDRVTVHMPKESSIDWSRISTHCLS